MEGELTSGRPDRKEGIYFGVEHAPDHPRVVTPTPLHGANQFPTRPPELRDAVLDWLTVLRPIADAVMQGLALGLGLPATWFEEGVTADPTILFRIFHYPPTSQESTDDGWGVGEHTDYGLLTLLAQDDRGGLQVKALDGSWIDVEPQPGVLVCNLGDMLERLTAGRYRSTPHRVRNTSGARPTVVPVLLRSVVGCNGSDLAAAGGAGGCCTRSLGRRGRARLGRHLRRLPHLQGGQGVPRPLPCRPTGSAVRRRWP